MKKKKKRIVYIDLIRLFAMLLVILAHSCALMLGNADYDNSNWRMANALVVITEIAVPLFFMISGATILNSEKTSSLEYLFKHRLTRVLVPFIIWSIISILLYSKFYPGLNIDSMDSILKIYHQPVLVAYWFIYQLITLYLLSPLIKAMVSHVEDSTLTYALILWFIFLIVLPATAKDLPNGLGVYFAGYFETKVVVSNYAGYFILGYRLTRDKHRHVNVWLNLLLVVILLAARISISFLTQTKDLNYLNIVSVAILPIIIILLYLSLRALEPRYPKWLARIVEFIAPLTYGVYLVHGIVILLLELSLSYTQYWLIFGLATVNSLAIILILHSIPGIRRLFT